LDIFLKLLIRMSLKNLGPFLVKVDGTLIL
jgi:hypothetical protein